MSRVAVVTSSPPFGEGGHLVIARALVSALGCAGHEADLVITPSHRFGRQARAYLATWLTDVTVDQEGRRVDQVISLRYPSYAVRHPVHVCWLNHCMREYYDLWPSFSATLSPLARAKERLRRAAIHRVDSYLLRRNVTRVVAQSKTIQQRLQRFGGVRSEVLYPPAAPRPYRCDEYGDYLFAVSRLTSLKRVDLLIEALALPDTRGVRCLIAGDGEERERLIRLVRDRGLDARVRLVGPVDSTELVEHLARCRAVCFPPYDEDYGLVTLEAFAARKAVITCTDSGGAAELVEAGVDGLISEPRPERLAAAIARVMDDRGLAERLGRAAFQKSAAMTWPAAVQKLLIV